MDDLLVIPRYEAAGLSELLTFELGDGAAATFEAEEYDAALCLGASFVFGSLALHWQSVERWLAENPDDPDAPGIRARYEGNKQTYLRRRRDALGWAIFVGWKRREREAS